MVSLLWPHPVPNMVSAGCGSSCYASLLLCDGVHHTDAGLFRHRPFRTILWEGLNFCWWEGCPYRIMQSMRERSRGKETHSSRASVRSFVLSAAIVAGFGLYRGVNSSAYLSAFAFVKSPFLFVPDLFFNVVVACSVVVCAGIAVLLALTGRLKAFSMPYVLPTGLLIAANAAALAGVVLSLPADMALLVPGVLYGAGSVMLSLFWIEVFSAEKPSVIVTQIALGMLLNVVVSAGLTPLDPDVQMKLSCVLLVIAALCARFVRRALPHACAEGAPLAGADAGAGDARACEQGEGAPAFVNADAGAGAGGQDKASLRTRFAAYRDAFLELGDSVVAFFVLEAVIGLLNSFMLTGSLDFEGSGKVSSGAIVGAIIVFCFVVFVMHRMPKVSTVSRVIMPVLAAMLVFLPFLSETYNLVFYMLLLGSYYFVALLITYLVAEVAHVRRVSPYVLMGVTMGVARVFLVVALLGGFAAAVAGGGPSDEGEHTMRYLVIIVVVLYALCMALVFFSRDRKRRREGASQSAGQDGPRVDGALAAAQADAAATQADAASEGERALESRCAAVAREGGLTEREAEVLVYLARGRTKAYIAEALFVTENTVRSHVRNIYSKLGIHTRQQLIDLVESPRS